MTTAIAKQQSGLVIKTAKDVEAILKEDDLGFPRKSIKTFTPGKYIVLRQKPLRSYWEAAYTRDGGGQRPDCSSHDNEIGWTVDGERVECAKCAYNKWGSSTTGKGRACSEKKELFVLKINKGVVTPLPMILTVPPTSIKKWKVYVRDLLFEYGEGYYVHVTEIEKEEGKYAEEFVFGDAGLLPEEAIEKVEEMREWLMDYKPTSQEFAKEEDIPI